MYLFLRRLDGQQIKYPIRATLTVLIGFLKPKLLLGKGKIPNIHVLAQQFEYFLVSL